MRILLTNDDGIHAEGLQSLEKIARTLSDDVWVVAPEFDQSGFAHSLSLSDPLRLRKIGDQRYAVRGTPTDCVIMGVRKILPGPPDLILSGVNSGANLADDVTYSGTVAGAIEGVMLGIRSFAISQAYNAEGDERLVSWEVCETLAPPLLKKLIKAELPDGVLLNINFPNCKIEEVEATEVTVQGRLAHSMWIDERRDGRNFPYYWLRFGRMPTELVEGTDVFAVRNRRVSVTPLQLDLTAHSVRNDLTKLLS